MSVCFLAIQACNPTDHEPVPPYPVRSRGIDRGINEEGPYNLAVLIANKLTAKPQVGVDYRGQNMVKS